MSTGRDAHRIERRRRFQSDWDVGGSSGDNWHYRNVSLLPRVTNRHPCFRMNRCEIAQDFHLLVAQPRCDAQLTCGLENLAQMRTRFSGTVNDLGNSCARLAIAVPANLRHDATNGSDILPL